MSMISTREHQIFDEMTAPFAAERESAARRNRPGIITRHRMTILAAIWAISLYGAFALTSHPAAAMACIVSLVAATAAMLVDTAQS